MHGWQECDFVIIVNHHGLEESGRRSVQNPLEARGVQVFKLPSVIILVGLLEHVRFSHLESLGQATDL